MNSALHFLLTLALGAGVVTVSGTAVLLTGVLFRLAKETAWRQHAKFGAFLAICWLLGFGVIHVTSGL